MLRDPPFRRVGLAADDPLIRTVLIRHCSSQSAAVTRLVPVDFFSTSPIATVAASGCREKENG